MNLDDILYKTINLVKKTGKFIRNEQQNITENKVESKGLHNLVTYVDKTAEKQLVDGLSAILPEAGFITEEQTAVETKDTYNWIVDPLDGTTNYVHGLFPVAISIALQERGKTILGIVYELGLNEMFYAVKDCPAYLNGNEIHISQTLEVTNSLIATGFPYYDYNRLDSYMDSFVYFMKNSRGLRRLGSAATDLVYVACGRFDSFYEYGLSPWDVAAGAFIVERAGGKVCDFSGEGNYIFGREIVATNNGIYKEFLDIITNFFRIDA